MVVAARGLDFIYKQQSMGLQNLQITPNRYDPCHIASEHTIERETNYYSQITNIKDPTEKTSRIRTCINFASVVHHMVRHHLQLQHPQDYKYSQTNPTWQYPDQHPQDWG
ncbi:hypothetical protein GDO86_008342 [Hymenochirus boettgeri]|uniref:Uncharacterized protein n=1 Tax=Hymenochirus boettgeri TaxID=247094 RepID=A0A8T2J186_9PIPI|nr:hypothetical protein GDO86_008342 [Hymenochirus boettgeri]